MVRIRACGGGNYTANIERGFGQKRRQRREPCHLGCWQKETGPAFGNPVFLFSMGCIICQPPSQHHLFPNHQEIGLQDSLSGHFLIGCFTVTQWQPQLRALHLHVTTVKGKESRAFSFRVMSREGMPHGLSWPSGFLGRCHLLGEPHASA